MSSHPRSHRSLRSRLALGTVGWLAVGFLGAQLFSACSLGEGVTATCVNADPMTENACQKVAVCDDGTGRVQPTEDCCIAEGTLTFLTCCQDSVDATPCPSEARPVVSEANNFQAFCNQAGDDVACCVAASNTNSACLARTPTTSSGGGMGGNAGSGGRGGAGGASATGGNGGSGGT